MDAITGFIGGGLGYVLPFLLVLTVVVFIHESGHFWVGRLFGTRIETFSIGFGRSLTSWTDRKGTVWKIGWLPLGGYVKISGMTRDEEVPDDVRHRTYHAAAVWKRVATIAAGPGVNIVVAFVAFAAMFWVGMPRTSHVTTEVHKVTAESPASAIGLTEGDRIVGVEGVSTTDPQRVKELLAARPGRLTRITYRHGAEDVTRSVKLQSATDPETGKTVGRLGFLFTLEDGPTVRSGPLEGVADSGRYTWLVTRETGKILGRQFTRPDIDQVNSVVGAGAAYNEVADRGFATVLNFIGLLSLALALFNLLPVPPLDGGHILFALIEKVRGSPLPRRAFETASVVGMVAITLLAVILIQNDIFRIANGTLMP